MTTLKDGTQLPGLFISLEGMDGTGKSSQARMIAKYLSALGADVVQTREPGGSEGAEEIRQLVLTGDSDRWSAETEILLFTAARRDHAEKFIIPALSSGKIVICDRFADSTRAYQGADNWKNVEIYDKIHELMVPVDPDMTLILDMDPKKCLDRGMQRLAQFAHENPDVAPEDRMESFGLSFQQALNANFERIAMMYPERCSLIDADGTMEEVMLRLTKAMSRNDLIEKHLQSISVSGVDLADPANALNDTEFSCVVSVHEVLKSMTHGSASEEKMDV